MRKDLLDHRLLQDRRDDPRLAAAVRAVLQVEIEHPLEQLDPAQPHRAMIRLRTALGCSIPAARDSQELAKPGSSRVSAVLPADSADGFPVLTSGRRRAAPDLKRVLQVQGWPRKSSLSSRRAARSQRQQRTVDRIAMQEAVAEGLRDVLGGSRMQPDAAARQHLGCLREITSRLERAAAVQP